MSLAVVRNLGVIGQVRVNYTTYPDTAYRNEDFLEKSGSLIFTAGLSSQAIVIRILPVSNHLNLSVSLKTKCTYLCMHSLVVSYRCKLTMLLLILLVLDHIGTRCFGNCGSLRYKMYLHVNVLQLN